jgi:hypothetical protein
MLLHQQRNPVRVLPQRRCPNASGKVTLQQSLADDYSIALT